MSFWALHTKRGMICKMNFMKQIFFVEPLHWHSLSLMPLMGSCDQTADRHHISLSNCFPIKNLHQTKTPRGRAGHEEQISEQNPAMWQCYRARAKPVALQSKHIHCMTVREQPKWGTQKSFLCDHLQVQAVGICKVPSWGDGSAETFSSLGIQNV